MTTNRVSRSLFMKLLPAQILVYAITCVNMLLNSLIIGNLMGADYLAVFGFVAPLGFIQDMISCGISAGSQILCGRYMGGGDMDGVSAVYSTVAALCAVCGGALTLVFTVFAPQLAALLGATEGAALQYTADYLRAYGLGMPFMLFSSSIIPYLQMNNAGVTMTLSVAAVVIVNVAGDLLNIFVFKGGMLGCGFASTAAYFAAVLVFVFYYAFGKRGARLSVRRVGFDMVKRIFTLGLPAFIMPAALTVSSLVLNNVAVRTAGPVALTAMAVISNVDGLFTIPISAINTACSMSAGIFYGERDAKSLRELYPMAVRFAFLCGGICYALVLLLAKPLALLFGAGADAAFVATALRIALGFYLTEVLYVILAEIYKGVGNTAVLNIVQPIVIAGVSSLLCVVLAKLGGINGMWHVFLLTEPIEFIAMLFYVRKKRGSFPKKLSDMVMIPDNAGAAEEDRAAAVIRDAGDVAKASEAVIAFCREKGMAQTGAFYCGLCVEEMAMAILSHASDLPKRKRRGREIDLRLIREADGISMMLRDNYPGFDPVEWMKLREPEDPVRSLGIRMVTKAAMSAEYHATLNLNVLWLKLQGEKTAKGR